MGATLLICVGLEYYFHIIRGITGVYTHLFYLPIVVASILWGQKGGVFLGLFCGFIHTASCLPIIDGFVLVRSLTLVFVGSAIGIISDRYKRAEEALRKKTYDLSERVKELNCLYGISKFIEEQDTSLEEVLQGIVDLIPFAWQYPEITCSRIIMGDKKYTTTNFSESVWKQSSDIFVHDQKIGTLEVFYLEERPEIDEGPFLKEERDLIKAIAERLGKTTERRHAEEELRLKNYAIESSINAIIFTDLEGDLAYVNRSFLKMWGYDNGKKVLGKNISRFWEMEESVKEIVRVLSDKGGYLAELVAKKKDGSIFHVQLSANLIKDEADRPFYLLGSLIDITDKKKLRQESEYRLQQIIHADKLASLGKVVAGVAHEINNPNSFIAYNAPLLDETWQAFKPIISDYAAAHPEWRKNGLNLKDFCQDMGEIVDAIKIGSERINQTVAALKEFARLDENNNFLPVQVNEAIKKTITIIGAQLRKSIGKIELNLASNLPKVEGNLQKIEQVIANLLINATHAIPDKNKGRLSITTRYLERLDHLLIEIEDNGIGMEPKDIGRICEPFFTNRRDNGGTGLGLSVSFGLIQEHNGAIGVLSRPGIGSRFTVYLPVERDTKLVLHPSILCVDNDVEFLKELTLYFAKVNGDSFQTTNNPEGVVEYLEEHPEVDIVLSKIMMPGETGWRLLEKVKARFPLLTFIMYTDHAQALKQKPNAGDAPDYLLQKPFNMEQLLATINNISRQRL